SIAYNNKLYMIGGRTNGTPGSGLNSVPTAFFDDNLNLIKIDGTNFIIGASEKVLNIDNDEGRYNMGVALVRAEPPDTVQGTLNSAWVFVIGGSDINGNETNTMYQGKIGGDDATADSYTPDGWYYSNIFQTSYAFGSGQWIEYEKARLVSFHWASSINRGSNTNADIQVYFRTKSTLTSLCTGDNIFTSSDPWIGPLDGYGGNPLYSTVPANGALYNNATLLGNYTDAQLTGNCVQYRAQILRGGSLLSVTPKLLSVSIKKEIAGNADLNIPTDGFSVTTGADNQISTMVMRVQNLSTLGLSQTISVPRAREANGLTADGSVYVNLCIARSDLDQPPPTLTLPNPNTFGSSADINLCRYYAHIYSYQLLKGTVIDLLGTNPNNGNNSYWFDNLNGYAPVPDIKSVFKQSGHYRIGLILDTANYGIPEGTPGEANNQSSMITFTIISPYTIFMPLILH
ncbi:MAG: hypothetical protein HGB28_04470, partial [Oscillochloris sp.]|nr:hypothetical protein [Oscillochloris sp.]